MKKYLDREAFLSRKVEVRDFEIPDFGFVKIKPMTLMERRQARKSATSLVVDQTTGESKMTVDVETMQIHTVILCTLGEDGRRLFSLDDYEFINSSFPSSIIDDLSNAIMGGSGLDEKSVTKSQAITIS